MVNHFCEKRKKEESLIFVIKKLLIIHIGLGYIYTCLWDPQYNKERKGKVNNWNNCTLSNTPPQAGAYMLYAPSLLQMYLILGPLRDLVKIFASWSFELTKLVVTHPDVIFSLMKW